MFRMIAFFSAISSRYILIMRISVNCCCKEISHEVYSDWNMILKSSLTRVQHRGRILRISTRDCMLSMSSPSNLWILSENYLCLMPTSSRRTVSILKHPSYYLKRVQFFQFEKIRCITNIIKIGKLY